ncbi:MAG: hypothetical protein EB027_06090 [Actinobacteria bacterium]|nr:hypothetical protein [Actinomycetota bacterium]
MTTEQQDALITLCLLPDEDGYQRRSIRTQAGDPVRAAKLLAFLPAVHAAHRVVDRENERLR